MRDVVKIGAALLVVALVVDLKPWDWPWGVLEDFYGEHVALVILGGAALAILAPSLLSIRRARRGSVRTPDLKLPWLVSNAGLVFTFACIVLVGLAAMTVMLWITLSSQASERAKIQVDVIKWSLGIIAASGAGAALLLNARRQLIAEYNYALEVQRQAHAEVDAAERRVTELYTKSVEQLGSDDAAVRLGGIYALERVAQGNASQRQTIVNVLCAYLRMPYAPPGIKPASLSGPLRELPLASVSTQLARDPHQELQVRLTAQRVLARHLRNREEDRPSFARITADSISDFWPGMDIDLRGAALIDFNFSGVSVGSANFAQVVFHGHAQFDDADFLRDASFRSAASMETVSFDSCEFVRRTDFSFGRFDGGSFDGVKFRSAASFRGIVFESWASFASSTFFLGASFESAEFAEVDFDKVDFTRRVNFWKASFLSHATFDNARFGTKSPFATSKFSIAPTFHNARVDPWDGTLGRWPGRWTVVPDPARPDVGLVVDRDKVVIASDNG